MADCGFDKLVDNTVQDRIAQMIVESTSQEELKGMLMFHFDALSRDRRNNWGNTERSIITNRVNNALLEAVSKAIGEIVETPEFKERARLMAIDIMDEIQENVKKETIAKITARLCGFQSDPYAPSAFRNEVATIVNEMIRR